ncbi:hypothetical protein VW35_16010 [Devosia soli]|uniref:Uncharacterized protein n=1 Tax=Devosia soli TaxID=361041 RepID=A0A0F5L450_9HYPH|nr:hypothetical protein [Devosia soli]KKB76989.1 hypothetical protein VW35_16010 [Devosia soli]
MSTLQQMRDEGYSLTIHCAGRVGVTCNHNWRAKWDQLIQYFGLEFDLSPETRARFLRRFRCEKCGSRAYTVMMSPPSKYEKSQSPWASHGYVVGHPEPPSAPFAKKYDRLLAEQDRLDSAWRAAAREREERIHAASNARAKMIREIDEARAKGIFLIGPPSPHLHKKGRPPMKG